jgi:hypothetical protein
MSKDLLGASFDKASRFLYTYPGPQKTYNVTDTSPQKLFQYCVGSHIDSASIRKLGVAYNACLRYIHGLDRRENVVNLQCSITGLNLKASATLQQLKFMFKIIHTQHPSYLFSVYNIHIYNRVYRKRGDFANPNGHAIVIKYDSFQEFLHSNF